MSEQDLLEFVKDGLAASEEPELRDVEFKALPTDSVASLVVTVDGAEYLVTVTQVKEAE